MKRSAADVEMSVEWLLGRDEMVGICVRRARNALALASGELAPPCQHFGRCLSLFRGDVRSAWSLQSRGLAVIALAVSRLSTKR